MTWVLTYLMMAFVNNVVQTGMHTTGPFASEAECSAYAQETWSEPDWMPEKPGRNLYMSNNIIHHLEHEGSNMALFYTCVEIRDPEKWRVKQN